jgi:hypothetical protein
LLTIDAVDLLDGGDLMVAHAEFRGDLADDRRGGDGGGLGDLLGHVLVQPSLPCDVCR